MPIILPDSILNLLESFSFRANTKLRPANSVIEYTAEMISEIKKCRDDPIYFICKYCKVIHVDKGIIPFLLYDYQKNLINAYVNNRKVITMQPRQSGKTQVTAAFLLWYVIFNENKVVAVLANKAAVARETLQRVQSMYEELPKWIQQGVKSWNKGSIHLENGSRILCAATTSSGLRGYTLSCIYLDELAIIPNNIADDFFASMFPTISSGKETKIIISSTPLGYNHFYKLWNEAEKGINGFIPIKVHWWEKPDRDEKWKLDQLETLGELKYNQEVMCLSGSSTVKIRYNNLVELETTLENLYNKYYDIILEENKDEQTIYVPNRMEKTK